MSSIGSDIWFVQPSSRRSGNRLRRWVDTIVAIENYYHLVMLLMKAFSRAVDQIHDYEQRHLYRRAKIDRTIGGTAPRPCRKWLTVLTQDLLQASRIGGIDAVPAVGFGAL